MLCIALTTALLIGSIVAGLAGAGAGIYGAAKNYQSQKETNAANVKMQQITNAQNAQLTRETNAQAMDLAKNAHQYEMADLKAAGLNPVLTATGGSGMSVPTLQTAQMQSPKQQAPQTDLQGVTNALNAMSHSMAMAMIADGRNQTAIRNTDARNVTSVKNNSSRNDVLNNLYKRKAERLGLADESAAVVNDSRQLTAEANKVHSAPKHISPDSSRGKLLKQLGYKYDGRSHKWKAPN